MLADRGEWVDTKLTTRPGPRTLLRFGVACISVAVGIGMVGVVDSPGGRFVGVLALLCITLVVAHIFASRLSGDALNLLSLAAAFYFVAFAAGSIYAWFALSRSILREDVTAALVLITVGWACFVIGYLVDPFRLVRSVLRPPTSLTTAGDSSGLVVALLVIGWIARVLELGQGRYYHIHATATVQGGSSWFITTAAALPLIALSLVGSRAFGFGGRARSRSALLLFLILLGSELVWALPSGSRQDVVDIGVLIVLVRYYSHAALPSVRVVAISALLLVFFVFPVIGAYRSGDLNSSPGGAVLATTTAASHRSPSEILKSGGDTLARFADVTAVASILQHGRGRMSFSASDTAVYSLQGFFPRAIFPEKANPGVFGNSFGRAYGLISPADQTTSIAVTQPGELYLGGGWIELILGMPIVGAFLRLLNDYLSGRRSDPGVLGLYAVVAPGVVFGLETSIAVGFIGAIKAAAFLALVIAGVAALLMRAEARPSEFAAV